MRAKQIYKIFWMRFSASVVMTITDLFGIQTLICTQTPITGKVEKENQHNKGNYKQNMHVQMEDKREAVVLATSHTNGMIRVSQ
jgi:hypothetical protein